MRCSHLENQHLYVQGGGGGRPGDPIHPLCSKWKKKNIEGGCKNVKRFCVPTRRFKFLIDDDKIKMGYIILYSLQFERWPYGFNLLPETTRKVVEIGAILLHLNVTSDTQKTKTNKKTITRIAPPRNWECHEFNNLIDIFSLPTL